MAEDYGHDNLGENSPHFDFSIVDYSVTNRGQTLKLDSVGAWKLNESCTSIQKYLLTSMS